MQYLKQFRKAVLVLTIFYSLYLIKSGLGIDISHNYHLADVFLRPVELAKATAHKFWKYPTQPAQTNSSRVIGHD